MNLFSLFYRGGPWLFFALALFLGWLGWSTYEKDLEREAEKALALSQEPPAVVNIQDYDPAEHRGPAREVRILAQLDVQMKYELTYKGKYSTKTAFMFPLIPADTTLANLPDTETLGILLIEADEMTDKMADILLEGFQSQGEVGPVLVLHGRAGSAGDFTAMVRDAFRENDRAIKSAGLTLRPYLAPREVALAPEKPGKTMLMLFGFGGFFLVVGMFNMMRGRKQKALAKQTEPSVSLDGITAAPVMAAAGPIGYVEIGQYAPEMADESDGRKLMRDVLAGALSEKKEIDIYHVENKGRRAFEELEASRSAKLPQDVMAKQRDADMFQAAQAKLGAGREMSMSEKMLAKSAKDPFAKRA